jgi:hypothetical protein
MLFKYRSFRPFEYIVDILAKRRLYASRFDDLNDPMEGRYLYENFGGKKEDMDSMLRGKKQKMRVCSLSEKPDDPLMWSHYADGHHGFVVGVEVSAHNYDVRSIQYDGPARIQDPATGYEAAKRVLSHKIDAWSYEKEVRVFVPDKHYVQVDLAFVACGREMSPQDKSLIKDVMQGLAPEVDLITQPEKRDLQRYV